MTDGKRCGAKTRGGGTCKNWAMPNGRCRLHGGMTPGGIASPHFRNGRHSRYLPARLLDRYRESVADPELLNLRSDIAVLDARISELLASVDAGESGRLWRLLSSLRRDFLAAQRAEDKQGMADAMAELLNAVARGAQDWERWQEVADFLERRRRLVESEQKRLVAMQQMVTAEQAMTLVAALAASVREAVLERVDADVGRAILSRVQADLARLSAAGPGREAGGNEGVGL